MKKAIFIFGFILTCQFLANGQDFFYVESDTIAYISIDTTAITLLVTACEECPAHAIKGYIYMSYNNSGYLDEYKQPLNKKYIVWDYRERKKNRN